MPNSRKFVQHINGWYAQAHPAEDFAETFAVWLTPDLSWRRRYAGWPALEKLEYVAELMTELIGVSPPVRTRRFIEPLKEIKLTLREHWEQKRQTYAVEWPAYYDEDLSRVFERSVKPNARMAASSFLRGHRRELSRTVAEATGVPPYTVDYVLKTMIERCRDMRLRLRESPTRTRERVLLMLTVHTMQVAHSGYFPLAI